MDNPFSAMSLLTKFIHINHIHLSKRIKDLDPSLSKPQASIIIHMSPHRGYRVGELAKILEVTAGAVTHASKVLIKKGYLLRENGEDLRTVYLSLTEKGKMLRERIIEEIEVLNKKVVSALDDKERRVFLKLLAKITTELEKEVFDHEVK